MTRLPLWLALAALALAVLAAPAAAQTEANDLEASCPLSHRAPDDPIVFPREAGDSHSHEFFGNRSTNARSTPEKLATKKTTCRPKADRSAYWVPTLRYQNKPIEPYPARIYGVIVNAHPHEVKAYPSGLRVIAGNPDGSNPGQPRFSWSCTESGALQFASIPRCAKGSYLVLRVRFPDCWDGSRRDSKNHQDHMAYSRDGLCPSSHPVATPQLRFDIGYPTRGGSSVKLSSGPPWTTHGDFMNAWDRSELKRRLRRCVFTGSCVEGPLGGGGY